MRHTQRLMTIVLASLLVLSTAMAPVQAVEIAGATKVQEHGIADLTVTGDELTDKTQFRWKVSGKVVSLVRIGKRLLFSGPPGDYKVTVTVVDFKKELFDETDITVTVGDSPSPPDPPDPPNPPNPPGPTPGAPIALTGFRVLIVEDSARREELPRAQFLAIFGKTVRDYLRTKAVNDSAKGYWILDKGVDVSALDKAWQDAFTLATTKAKSYPWLIVSNGKSGYQGPVPASADDMLALLKKYGEHATTKAEEKRTKRRDQ